MSKAIDISGCSYVLEKQRLESFKIWPFSSDVTCSIQKMAEAGFYWCGNNKETDIASCFVCGKTLDGWEAADEPWEEHQKHAPQCAFVKLGKPEKELTVDEFLTLFGIYTQNHLQKKYNENKADLEIFCKKMREEILNLYKY